MFIQLTVFLICSPLLVANSIGSAVLLLCLLTTIQYLPYFFFEGGNPEGINGYQALLLPHRSSSFPPLSVKGHRHMVNSEILGVYCKQDLHSQYVPNQPVVGAGVCTAFICSGIGHCRDQDRQLGHTLGCLCFSPPKHKSFVLTTQAHMENFLAPGRVRESVRGMWTRPLCLFHTLLGLFMFVENIYSTNMVWLAVQCIYPGGPVRF